MANKYIILQNDSIQHEGRTLYRIKALRSFKWVSAGDLGGYIEGEHNLSQIGTCWVFDDAKIFDKAIVRDEAEITNEAQVFGEAIVEERSIVADQAKVYGYATIDGQARIYEHASVKDNGIVRGYANLSGYATVSKYGLVSDMADVNFNIRDQDEYAIYTDPKESKWFITAATKENWFNAKGMTGTKEEFLASARKESPEKEEAYRKIVDLHLDLYGLK